MPFSRCQTLTIYDTTIHRLFIFRTNQPRMASRAAGTRSVNPTRSVRNPGVRRSAPAIRIIAPCTMVTDGDWPVDSSYRNLAHVSLPCLETSADPRNAVATTMATVGHSPIALPTRMKSAISIAGTTRNRKNSHVRIRMAARVGQPPAGRSPFTVVAGRCSDVGCRLYACGMEMRDLPSVDALAGTLTEGSVQQGLHAPTVPMPLVLHVARTVIDEARELILAGAEPPDLVWSGRQRLASMKASMPRAVVNATGVLLHTNLGRAPVPRHAAQHAADIAASASNVELDIRTGLRSRRRAYLGHLLPVVTGAEAGFAVNNNAGALLLALASVAGRGGRVAVSRGELIEIGGSFRLPSLMEASGATLVEVGTTNRTRRADYEAVAGDVDAILKVHPSNYRIDGFAEEASYEELAALAAQHAVPFIADIGSGLMDATAPWLGDADRSWLRSEPGVIQTVAAGTDLVLFSGDKLMGGPQAGIIVGKKEAVERAARHPIARAVRLDGQSIASLASVVEMYADARVLDIPFWSMASTSVEDLKARAAAIVAEVGDGVRIVDSASVPGAGSVPGESIPSIALRLDGDADQLWTELAAGTPAVISVRRDGAVHLDLRSVDASHDSDIVAAIAAVIG